MFDRIKHSIAIFAIMVASMAGITLVTPAAAQADNATSYTCDSPWITTYTTGTKLQWLCYDGPGTQYNFRATVCKTRVWAETGCVIVDGTWESYATGTIAEASTADLPGPKYVHIVKFAPRSNANLLTVKRVGRPISR